MLASEIGDHDRKRLWAKSGDACAYTGCGRPLLEPTDSGHEDTVVGVECHIIPRRDHASVARAPCLLTETEKVRWAHLVERRHDFPNLVLMCGIHARVIDDPNQGFSVEQVVAMKRVHEAEVELRHRMELPDQPGAVMVPADIRPARPASQLLLLEDVPAWQQKSVAALAQVDPDALAWLRQRVGVPAVEEEIVNLVSQWTEELDRGPDELLILLAREAEAVGLWDAAADVWERLAERAEGAARADRLTRAAIDAGVGADGERRERLLAAAETVDPESPRLKLERLDDEAEPAEQLALLADLHTDDPPLAALIACHRARAQLLMSDVDSAAESLTEAESLDPGSVAVRATRVNLEVQKARVALRDDQEFITARALDTRDQALELRETLVAMGRWEESVRLLMLAAEVPALLRDPEGAEGILKQARPEEIGAPDGAEVLGDAALRVGAPELALRFTEDAPSGDAVRRIRATAQADLPGPQRVHGLETLEELALGAGPEREHAAVSRLLVCLPPVKALWNEPVAQALEGGEHERTVASLRPMVAAFHDPEKANQLASQLPDEAWAAEVRLRVAGAGGNKDSMRETANAFLRFAPDASGRLLAARALAQADELELAGQITTDIAYGPNNPPRVRSDAFHTLIKTLADRDEWRDVERTWASWRDFSFRELSGPDGRVSAWQVRVEHHKERNHR